MIDNKRLDELMATSLQMENYLMQRASYQNISPETQDIDNQLHDYLSAYRRISVQLQFKIFLFSSFYARKLDVIGVQEGGSDV